MGRSQISGKYILPLSRKKHVTILQEIKLKSHRLCTLVGSLHAFLCICILG